MCNTQDLCNWLLNPCQNATHLTGLKILYINKLTNCLPVTAKFWFKADRICGMGKKKHRLKTMPETRKKKTTKKNDIHDER